MKLAIDIDDTILGFYREFAEFCNERYGTNLTEKQLGLDFFGSLNSKGEIISALRTFLDEGHGYNLKFFEDFRGIFGKLKEDHDLILLTSRSYDLREKTLEFLRENLEDFDLEVHYTFDYLAGKKSFVCKKEDVEVLVDDDGGNALDCAENGIKVFLLNKSWNKDVQHENIVRCDSWIEIIENLEGLKENGD